MNSKFPVEKEAPVSSGSAITKSAKNNNSKDSTLPIWVYIIFRKNPSSGHEKLNLKER